jgi:dihydropteroate synthase
MLLVSPHGRPLELDDGRTRLMGVLNVTPDSFSDGGRFASVEAAVAEGERMAAAGAAVLDLGAESTRPGHAKVPADEQIRRLLPVLERLRPRVACPISIDTTRAAVARRALAAGADWINDTSALAEDRDLAPVVAEARCPVVLMHSFSPPRRGATTESQGEELVAEVISGLRARIAFAVEQGIAEQSILVDPGIGFGTTARDALTLLARVPALRVLGRPLVVGPSRKSFLGALTGKPPATRSYGTAATVAVLALHRVALVRVHDVAEMHDVTLVAGAIAAADPAGGATHG